MALKVLVKRIVISNGTNTNVVIKTCENCTWRSTDSRRSDQVDQTTFVSNVRGKMFVNEMNSYKSK